MSGYYERTEDIKDKMRGERNPSKRPEVQKKIQEFWTNFYQLILFERKLN